MNASKGYENVEDNQYSKKTSRKSEVSHGTDSSQEETKVTEPIDPWLRKHSEDAKKRHHTQLNARISEYEENEDSEPSSR